MTAPLVEAEHLSVHYPVASPSMWDRVRGRGSAPRVVRAVDGVDLVLEQGEMRALIGPNGCGKSTLFDLITGAVRADSGRIVFAGTDITRSAPHRIARLGIGRKFQVTAVFDDLSVLDNIRVAARANRAVTIDALLNRLRLTDRRNTPAGVLSHGERQWLEIGMVLAGAPRLLLLDEPSMGLSPK